MPILKAIGINISPECEALFKNFQGDSIEEMENNPNLPKLLECGNGIKDQVQKLLNPGGGNNKPPAPNPGPTPPPPPTRTPSF